MTEREKIMFNSGRILGAVVAIRQFAGLACAQGHYDKTSARKLLAELGVFEDAVDAWETQELGKLPPPPDAA